MELTLTENQTYLKEMTKDLFADVVDFPDSVVVTPVMKAVPEMEGAESLTFLVSVHDEDTGRAIGKQGRIANAVRVLVKAAAMRLKAGKVFVEVQGEKADVG